MNGKVKTIEAIQIVHHTGTVWSATFPLPEADFLADMGWGVGLTSGPNLPWQAYGMRKETPGGKAILTIRFHDRSQPHLPPDFDVAQIVATLRSPMP